MTDAVGPQTRRVREKVHADPEAVTRWETLLDEDKVDDRTFLEQFKIRTEDPDEDGLPRAVQFNLRAVQIDLHDLEDELEFRRGVFGEVHVPKARKHGISTHSAARYGFARVLRRAGYETIITAQSIKATKTHRETLRYLYGQVDWTALRALGHRLIEATGHSFAVRHPNGMVSRVDLLTAKAEGLGRGGTPNAVLSTERPFYPARAREDFSGILGSLRKVRGNVWIDESSAKSEGDEFHTDCLRCIENPKGVGKILFFPSYRHPLNYIPFEDDEARDAFVKRLGDERYGDPGEETLVRERVADFQRKQGLSEDDADAKALEFLNWRRLEIDTTCRGSLDYFHREHPTVFDEAFLGAGAPVFDLRILRTWGDPTQERMRSATTGRLREDETSIRFDTSPAAPLLVLEPPDHEADKEGRLPVYAWGCDVASGKKFQSGTTKETDWSVIVVLEVYTGRTVAKYRAHCGTTELARQLILLARWYNEAEGLVELGGGYGDSVVNSVVETEENAWTHLLIATTTDVHTKVGVVKDTRYGFNASRPGKGVLANRGEEFINNELKHFRTVAGHADPASPFDTQTLGEIKKYSYEERSGRMEAMSGHDDSCVAWMLAMHARAKAFADGMIPARSQVSIVVPKSDARKALEAMDARKAKEAEHVDPDLGY